ncbi:RICIN domain-containing protein, partial [Acrocarpospora phusangensis]|uniref:RICIN domain-containing protein n=1 Tax=Acrocarpospora phusangensis TaxID=1070424 RepID=UPI00195171F0
MRKPAQRGRRWHALWLATVVAATSTTIAVTGVPAQAATAVNVWVTTADAGKLLQQQPGLTFGADSGNATTIDVSDANTYQTMDGFGASFTDSSAWLVWNRLSAGQRDQLMNNLFSRTSGIGLSMLRQPMGTSDFAVNGADYTYDDTCCDLGGFSIDHDRGYIIPVLRQAKGINPELKIMGTPWSPPAWMKTNNSLFGGSLRADRHAVWADYMVRYTQAYAAEGLPIYALTLQNEPHHETSGYASMRMEPAEQAAVVKNQLGPKLAAAGTGSKIIVWDHNWDEPGYPISVLNDADAKRYIAGSGLHCYAGDVSAQNTIHNAHPDKDIWFTECSGGGWATEFGGNLKWNLQNLIIGATRNWAKGVTLWNMALDQNSGPTNGGCTNCRGVVTVDQNNGNVTYNVEYYVLGHASKFVRSGARRIDSSSYANDLESVAFKNPDGSVALVTLNAGSGSKAFKVRWKGQSITYTLPAGAAATFTWGAGGTDPSPSPSPSPGGPIDTGAWYQVVNVNSGKCVDAAGWGTGNGTAVQQWTCGSAQNNQQWQFRPTSDGFYQVVGRNAPAQVWDVSGGAGATGDGVKIQTWVY